VRPAQLLTGLWPKAACRLPDERGPKQTFIVDRRSDASDPKRTVGR
jgi:hypothetical protein